MSSEFPEFKSTVQIEPAAVPNVQSSFAAIGGVFQDLTNQVLAQRQNLVNEQAKQAGEIAGSDPAFQPSASINETTRVYNDAALNANKTQNLLNIRSAINNAHNKVTAPGNFTIANNPVGSFQREISEFKQNYFPQIPAANKQAAENAFSLYAQDNQKSIVRRLDSLTYNTAITHLNNSTAQLKADADGLAFSNNPDAAVGLYGVAAQGLNHGVNANLISQNEADDTKKNLQQSISSNHIVGQMQTQLDAGKGQQFLDNFTKKSPPPGFGVLDKTNLTMKLMGMQQGHEQKNAVDNASMESTLNRVNTSLQQGLPVDFQHNLDVVGSRNPALAQKYKQKFIISRLYGTALNAMKYSNLGQRQQILQAAEQTISSSNIIEKNQILNALTTGSEKQIKAAQNDPFAYVSQSPIVQNSFQSYQLAQQSQQEADVKPIIGPHGNVDVQQLLFPQQNNINKTPQPVDWVESALQQEKELGLPQAVMSNKTASSIVSEISPLSAAQQVVSLQTLIRQPQYKNHAAILLQNLKKAGLKTAVMPLLNSSLDPNTSALTSAFADSLDTPAKDLNSVFKTKQSTLQFTSTDFTSQIASDLKDYDATAEGYNKNTATIQTNAKVLTKNMAIILMAKGMGWKEAIKTSSEVTTNHNFGYTGAFNKTLKYPSNLTSSQVESGGRQLILNSQTSPLFVPPSFAHTLPNETPVQIQQSYKDFIASHGYLIANAGTTKMVLVGGDGSPVLSPDGQKFEVPYSDLNDPTSDFMQEVNSHDHNALLIGHNNINAFSTAATAQIDKRLLGGFQVTPSKVKEQINKIPGGLQGAARRILEKEVAADATVLQPAREDLKSDPEAAVAEVKKIKKQSLKEDLTDFVKANSVFNIAGNIIKSVGGGSSDAGQ